MNKNTYKIKVKINGNYISYFCKMVKESVHYPCMVCVIVGTDDKMSGIKSCNQVMVEHFDENMINQYGC